MSPWVGHSIALVLIVVGGFALIPLAALLGLEPNLLGTEEAIEEKTYWDPGVNLFFDHPPTGVAYDEEEQDLLEALLRHLFKTNPFHPRAFETSEFVFVGFKGPDGLGDPPAPLMGRLADLPSVLPVSACEPDPPFGGVKHRESPGRSIMFAVHSLRWVEEGVAEVETYYRSVGSSGYLHRVERSDGRWVVVEGGHAVDLRRVDGHFASLLVGEMGLEPTTRSSQS